MIAKKILLNMRFDNSIKSVISLIPKEIMSSMYYHKGDQYLFYQVTVSLLCA